MHALAASGMPSVVLDAGPSPGKLVTSGEVVEHEISATDRFGEQGGVERP
jgi:hypothetical protein